MLHVGITGGIGSGKTTVCKIFEILGIPVYYADERAKWLMEHQASLVQGILGLLGQEAYTGEGKLNRSWISGKVFGNPELLSQLNALVHPAVAQDGFDWQDRQTDCPYTLKEAALLFESGSYLLLDKTIVVTAPLELRIKRVMDRDGVPRQAVQERIDRQMPEEDKVRKADYVIHNDGQRLLIPQVIAIHQGLVEAAKAMIS
ncbi:MAG: dephospho-CoA kinase [Haliscomenobacter sp.]|nr:dephospho-CoA kinase [Haliscomenobacter sp.]